MERSGGGGGEDASSEEGRGARDDRVAEPRERHSREREREREREGEFWVVVVETREGAEGKSMRLLTQPNAKYGELLTPLRFVQLSEAHSTLYGDAPTRFHPLLSFFFFFFF